MSSLMSKYAVIKDDVRGGKEIETTIKQIIKDWAFYHFSFKFSLEKRIDV